MEKKIKNILPDNTYYCWVCGSDKLHIVKTSNIEGNLDTRSFAITDSNYGVTGELHQCAKCGFIQASKLKDVLAYYEKLDDSAYVESRSQRSIQAKKILKRVKKICPTGRLLDVGAGIGILVEQAIELGYDACGIEPSEWLQRKAVNCEIPIHLGTLPNPKLKGPYDIICIVDIIEHVSNPRNILYEISKILSKNGVVVVVTPNVSAIITKLLRHRWWHYRVAHIGYFNKKTLNIIFENAKYELIEMYGACWYLPLDYIIRRVNVYLPSFMHFPIPKFFKNITTPLNLGDSILGIYKLKGDNKWK